MNLLTNAIESIRVGVEDWQAGSRPRLLSAIRNIHAGILLLYKEALLRLSPPESDEVLIKAKQRPVREKTSTSQVRFVGVGRRTVDAQQIRERFEGLGIYTDWDRFKGIANVRNDIEHYYADVTHDSLRGVIASAFVIIRAFCVDELGEEPRELLGQAAWDAMLEAAEVYEEERRACDEALSQVIWNSAALEEGVRELRCQKCGSDLLRPDAPGVDTGISLICRSCGGDLSTEEYIVAAVQEALAAESYIAAKEGGEDPLADCPSCGYETYVMEEGRCVLCGEEAEHECSRCGSAIPASEMGSSPLCSYCEYVMTKDD